MNSLVEDQNQSLEAQQQELKDPIKEDNQSLNKERNQSYKQQIEELYKKRVGAKQGSEKEVDQIEKFQKFIEFNENQQSKEFYLSEDFEEEKKEDSEQEQEVIKKPKVEYMKPRPDAKIRVGPQYQAEIPDLKNPKKHKSNDKPEQSGHKKLKLEKF